MCVLYRRRLAELDGLDAGRVGGIGRVQRWLLVGSGFLGIAGWRLPRLRWKGREWFGVGMASDVLFHLATNDMRDLGSREAQKARRPALQARRTCRGDRLRKSFFKDFASRGGSQTHGLFRLAFHPLALLPKPLDHSSDPLIGRRW